ncbi:MAG: IPT/TIG domain-containing protein, partial [Acidobacteriota bacterium]
IPPYRPDPVNPGRMIPAPIDAGTESRPAYLVLYGTGLRNAQAATIRGLIGGMEIPIEYFGAVGDYAGLDQVNLRLPHTLKGRGLVDVTIVVNGVSSNPITLDLAGSASQTLAISGFGVNTPALAGQTITIRGNGFSAKADENVVRFGPAQARVIASTTSQLTVIVPFGAQSGQVTVQTNQVEARSIDVFKVKTSISGIIQSTGLPLTPPSPLSNVTVRLAGTNISVRTTPQGTFVLSDIPPGVSLVEVDGGTTTANPPYPAVTLKLAARADRDNQIPQPISLQQINGASANVGGVIGPSGFNSLSILRAKFVDALMRESVGDGSISSLLSTIAPSSLPPLAQFAPLEKSVRVSNRGVSIEVPFGTAVRFPDGKSSGQIQLTVLEGTRLPGITIPAGINPESVAQITPLGARFQPGASISFPNPASKTLRPGERVPLYRYDATSGSFIRRGTGIVSVDGSRIDSDGRVVDMASFWMVATTTLVTTVTGRVIDLQGLPISGARVSVNGRTGLTDLNGGFTIADVAASTTNRLQAEAIVPQQFGIPPQGVSGETPVVVGGVTNVGTIALTNTRQAGLVLSPFTIDLPPNTSSVPVNVTLTEPAPVGGLTVTIISEDTTVVSVPGTITIPAGQTTTTFNVNRAGPGAARIDARAVLRNASLESAAVVSVALPGPVLSGISPLTAPIGGRITITGTGLNPIASNHFVSFIRNNELLAILNPSENEIALDSNGRPSLRVRVPAISPGPVSVAVAVIDSASGVVSENSGSIQMTISELTVAAPSLALALPGEGRPRDKINIIGSGFSVARQENQVFFTQSGPGGQSGISVEGQVLEASPTSLIVAVPALGINRGNLKITARRLDASGATSGSSNAINFTVTSDPVAPTTPILTTVANLSNGTASGKDGDRLRASGSAFGYSFFSTQNVLNSVDPIVTLVVFTQNREFINFSVPLNALGGNQIETIVPSGLKKGLAEVTVF